MRGGFGRPDADGVRRLVDRLDAALCEADLGPLVRVVVEQRDEGLFVVLEREGRGCHDYVHVDFEREVVWMDVPDHQALGLFSAALVDELGGSDADLRPGQTVSLAPLRMANADALVPTAAVRSSRLISLSLQTAGRRPSRVTIEADDVLAELRRRPDLHVRRGILAAACLSLELEGAPRPQRVEIRPPFTLGVDWGRPSTVDVLDYLLRRGFVLAGRADR